MSNRYFSACSTGKTESVAAFLDSGVAVEARDQYGLTGLIWAGRKGQVGVADLLIARGADLEAVDRRGRTALFHAATYKRYDFVQHLAKLGANVSPVDMHGWTPLDVAEVSHYKKMAGVLQSLGAVTARVRA